MPSTKTAASACSALFHQPTGFEHDLYRVARFGENVICACTDRAIEILSIAVAGDRQERNGAGPKIRAEAPAQLDAVDAGNRDVREDEIRKSRQRFLERLKTVVRLLDDEPFALEDVRIKLTHLRVVFDDQDEPRATRRIEARGHLDFDVKVDRKRQQARLAYGGAASPLA